jgi:hypothetical protein
MRPRLEAEESLLAHDRVAVGTGGLKAGQARKLMTQWRQTAQGGRKSARRPRSPQALGRIGIGYRVIEKQQPSHP